jgi:26S proteasome regulatory subunit N7
MSDLESDWEKRTKLMIFESINLILTRQIELGAKKMLQLVSTYNGPEIIPYETFAYYICIFNLMTLPRK